MSIRADVDELIRFLDGLAKIDPAAVGALIAARVPCNEQLANHETVQTGIYGGESRVGFLGVLNGFAGTYDEGKFKGWGPIAAVIEDDGRCSGFRRTQLLEEKDG